MKAVIVQARMGSKRFPGKSMADLSGKPVLQHVLERCLKVKADRVILAVPDEPESGPMLKLAEKLGCNTFAGSETDVLWRYAEAADEYGVEVILRVTADCPLLNPDLCRQVLDACEGPYDYISNMYPIRTFPKGWDCEAFTWQSLIIADMEALSPYDREHVTPWMQRQKWARDGITQEQDQSNLNYCIDYPEDLAKVNTILNLENVAVMRGPNAP